MGAELYEDAVTVDFSKRPFEINPKIKNDESERTTLATGDGEAATHRARRNFGVKASPRVRFATALRPLSRKKNSQSWAVAIPRAKRRFI